MTNQRIHGTITSNVLAWSSQGAHMHHELDDEAVAEADEPPDDHITHLATSDFKRTLVRKQADHSKSLLTKALHEPSDDEEVSLNLRTSPVRRRSMTSNISLASTADLTPDTGLTSPERTNSPSPPPSVMQLGGFGLGFSEVKTKPATVVPNKPAETVAPVGKVANTITTTTSDAQSKNAAIEVLAKKRCISFACGPKAEVKKPIVSPQPSLSSQRVVKVPSEQPVQRRTCIKFACPSKPPVQNTPPSRPQVKVTIPDVLESAKTVRDGSPATLRKYRSPSSRRSHRSLTPRRRVSNSPAAVRSKKYLTADSADLSRDASRFHEFASDEPQEDDWIRQNLPASTQRLTINDTLRKENEIRRLGREAEEEALEEEFVDDEPENEDDQDDADDDDDDEEEDDDDDEDADVFGEAEDVEDEDDHLGYASDCDNSDGYHTDNEVGFADSDDEDDDDELELWTLGQASTLQLSGATPVGRRPSLSGNRSDSSSSSDAPAPRRRASREKTRRIRIRPGTPELPDSTDFVCGTLDEDRPLEDAYISCITQKRREKLHVIPQDIDPSFPTSEPEDEEDNAAQESDDHVWIHGELEDLHHEPERADRRKKAAHSSPKRYHSPPPKRHHSPAPKGRGRSPRRLFDRHSPRRLVSPPPPFSGRTLKSPPASPAQKHSHKVIDFKSLAAKPGLTHTKSLPRPPAIFPHNLKGQRRRQATHTGASGHVRGAIDIVKGLEQKRQRRREKYIQKHCNKARKGQVAMKRPEPGKGAQRMRELGLHMAGKNIQQNYVLSI